MGELAPIDPSSVPVDELRARMRLLLDDPTLIPSESVPSGSFRCSLCLRVSKNAWSDEEAEAEMLERFGPVPESEREYLCDDCNDIVKADMGF